MPAGAAHRAPIVGLLDWPACLNVRDLGGHRLPGGRRTMPRVVVRADSLCRLEPDGVAAVRRYGVGLVVDLRSPEEIAAAPHPFAERRDGVAYLNVPLIDPPTAAALDRAAPADHYPLIAELGRARIGEAVAALASGIRTGRGVLFHCHAGKDRTGIVAALLLRLAGVEDAAIAADYALSDVRLRPLHERWIAEAESEAERARRAALVVPDPARMAHFLDWIDGTYGGVRGYLEAAGVAGPVVERLRRALSSGP
ncbi:MAG TPA: tyrosine-protein phosphatase [Candidatus Limnocylindrales bacterium]|nr:tyrosine-protein phosphatase [Candidatus Limnocylindrales bacterium]